MNDSTYNYPQSSCNCTDIKNKNFNKYGTPTSLGVKSNDICNYYNYFDTLPPFRDNMEPTCKSGFNILNPQASTDKYAKEFQRFDNSGKSVFVSTDPRLIDVVRSDLLRLDRPPIDSSIKLDTIYKDNNLINYGKNYKTYSDIGAGQITYYVDKSIEDPFFQPNFTINNRTTGTLYQDPMGSTKPQYNRYPIKSNDPINSDKFLFDNDLSWIDDSTFHREDLMEKQMRKRLQQRWEPRWSSV